MTLPLGSGHIFFFFNDTATTEIYTLSLHDALPICLGPVDRPGGAGSPLRARSVPKKAMNVAWLATARPYAASAADRKSTRLNSSHDQISYAVFCLKKKNNRHQHTKHKILEERSPCI